MNRAGSNPDVSPCPVTTSWPEVSETVGARYPVVIGGNWVGANTGEHPLREHKVIRAEAVLFDMFLYRLDICLEMTAPLPPPVRRD